MIDIENQVIQAVSDAAVAIVSDILISSTTPDSIPSKLPAVNIYEAGNDAYMKVVPLSLGEVFSNLFYQIDIFSYANGSKKAECRSLLSAIDTKMQSLGFVRVSVTPINLNGFSNAAIRYSARYKGVAGASINGSKIQIYRS